MRTILAAVLAAVAFSATGCGGNDTEADAEASKAITDSIVKEQKTGGSPASLLSIGRREADCIGDGLVAKIGREKLRAYGVLTKENTARGQVTDVAMSAADAKVATDVLFGCADVEAMVEKAMAASGAVAPSMKSCIDKAVNQENLRSMFTRIFEGKPSAARQDLLAPITRCAVGSAG